jgi:peptidoglycan hydrolase-like amidase
MGFASQWRQRIGRRMLYWFGRMGFLVQTLRRMLVFCCAVSLSVADAQTTARTVSIQLFSHLKVETAFVGATKISACGTSVCVDGQPRSSYQSSGGIRLSSGPSRELPGLKTIRNVAGKLQIFVAMPLEDAVAAVTESEARGMRQLEANKVVAIAARSFYSGTRRHVSGFCDSTHCQTLRRVPGESEIPSRAARETAGKIVSYQGRAIPVLYATRCGGRSLTARDVGFPTRPYPYFAVDCSVCQRRPDPWTFRLPISLKGWVDGLLRTSREHARITLGRKYGWAKVRSNHFTMEASGSEIVFRGQGLGHSLGLCLFGVQGLAAEGWEADKILRHYLPGTE